MERHYTNKLHGVALKTKTLHADTTASPPPKSDYDKAHSKSKVWYADDKKAFILTAKAGLKKAVTITMNDSPGPGWWHQDQKTHGDLFLKTGHAVWGFETYVCVRSLDDPTRFFRRTKATWSIDVKFDEGDSTTVSAIVSPPTLNAMTADVSADPGSCPTGGQSANDWLNNTMTFK